MKLKVSKHSDILPHRKVLIEAYGAEYLSILQYDLELSLIILSRLQQPSASRISTQNLRMNYDENSAYHTDSRFNTS